MGTPMLLYSCKAANNSERRNAHEYIRYHRITYACPSGGFLRYQPKEIAAPEP